MKLDRVKITTLALQHLGQGYKLGAEWDLKDPNPEGPVDCSEFIEWLYARCGIVIPDGSFNQFNSTEPTATPLPGDLGFFFTPDKKSVHHVGMIADEKDMIEARGEPFNKIILRPRAKWERWKDFTGYRRLKSLS